MNSIYALLFATLINLACTNAKPNQSPGRIAGRWLPVRSIISCIEDGKKSFEKIDSSFTPMDIMVFKDNGTLDDGGERYDAYTIDLKTKELTLSEPNGDGITFKIRTMNQDELVIFREDQEVFKKQKRQMKLEIYFRRL
ncbi:hypothetical protein [Chitinophaga arvensicola]|uniref:Lipocalin-like domain-containing protein n=1 Tax=Chitinophaga arvensicola TaxID=29529 RepID=A0A1I0S6H7_9BACT|nr:hypothetical protein [Chitinophaga arvensicola]SEW51093.1 hypothetical protein SAMN04488122_4125 [Chitinophaga arvensicola]